MVDGIYLKGRRRPKSKKEVKEAILADPSSVLLEKTSMFDHTPDDVISNLPVGRYSFVGPDPHLHRNFYGTIVKKDDGTIKVA